MGRQKNKENMRMVRVAVTSDSGGQILSEKGGVQPCRQPFSEGMLSFQQEVDKSIALDSGKKQSVFLPIDFLSRDGWSDEQQKSF